VRVLSHLDADLDDAYASAVAPLAPAIERTLRPEVVANRVDHVSEIPPFLTLRPWSAERSAYRAAYARLGSVGLLLRTDITACYPSIRPAAVEEALGRCHLPVTTVARCVGLLRDLELEGVDGLPVGPIPSAVLANAVLAVGDAVLVALEAAFVRWVDDWWIAVRSAGHAADLLHALADALALAGLRLNERKTRLGGPGGGLGGGASSAGYHRATDADALPVIPGPDAVVPRDGGVGLGGRPPRRASGQR
jgi:hypothetical protein